MCLGGGLERFERFAQVDLSDLVQLDDAGEFRLSLSMDATRPPDWMDDRNVGCIATDERRGEAPGGLELAVLLGDTGRLRQPPVPVQFGLHLAAYLIGPLAAAGDDHGRRTDQPAQKRQPDPGVGVDLDGQG